MSKRRSNYTAIYNAKKGPKSSERSTTRKYWFEGGPNLAKSTTKYVGKKCSAPKSRKTPCRVNNP